MGVPAAISIRSAGPIRARSVIGCPSDGRIPAGLVTPALDRLAMARRDLRMIEQQLYMGNVAGPRPQADGQAFIPAQPGHR